MLSFTQIVYIIVFHIYFVKIGLTLCVLCYGQISLLKPPSTVISDEQLSDLSSNHAPLHEFLELYKRRSDSRGALPLFRGSNLGIFVRKRPDTDHSMTRRKETRNDLENSILADEDATTNLLLKNHRRHEYDDSAGPMFG
ncbi:unnamed protein product [Didymodactylos carnosus]|uniref:Uncharacterized protein n=1 Tax=Didymodactylos carnosus TaxID=1234261 RepID=A0A8S2CPW0_9BILA|nr:unnamed protein product [Didymodactylos carnosus]CAF3508637.1 unnamed protein product [Didymodactylos carnosus]